MNKKISTEIAIGTILVISVIIGGLVWLNSKQVKQLPVSTVSLQVDNQPVANQQQKDVDLTGANQKQQSEVPYKEPEAPTCDKKSNMVYWDESKNGSYYTPGEPYFTLNYPCSYQMEFTDTGSFYTISNGDRGPALQYGLNISRAFEPNERINIVKDVYEKPEVESLDVKYNTNYSYNVYQVTISKNEDLGECIECPGDSYHEVDLKVSNDIYYNFTSPTSFDKNVLKKAVESFIYHEK